MVFFIPWRVVAEGSGAAHLDLLGNIGKVVATWTIETMNGSGLRSVISQPDAALYIQPPMFETTVAVQITAKTECRNGLQGEGVLAEVDNSLALIRIPRLDFRNLGIACLLIALVGRRLPGLEPTDKDEMLTSRFYQPVMTALLEPQ
jgi:hypothetical protein